MNDHDVLEGGECEFFPALSSDDAEKLYFELLRLKALNRFLVREVSRLNAEIQRIIFESAY